MNILKCILSIILSCFIVVFSCHSKEKSQYKCIYQLDFLRDTLAMNYFRQETYIVQIGDNITKGFTYQKFYLDSLRTHDPDLYGKLFRISVEESIEAMRRTGDVSSVHNNTFHSGAFASDLYKDYKKGEIRVKDNVSIYEFIYKDELKPQDWEIMSDTATLLGYHCQKAQCYYRGRYYEAWFTPDIPISEGPWKFYGLPGLITKLHDIKNHYSFILTGFQKIEEEIDTKISSKVQEIERKDFIRLKMGSKGEKIGNAAMATVGLSSSKSEKTEKHYDYIELDYK